MAIQKIFLKDFRNYSEKEIVFIDGVNVIYGDNANGKTNILEAIYLASVGESFRARKTEEMVRFGQEVGSVSVDMRIDNDSQDVMVVVNGGIIMGKKVNKRKYLINGVSRRRSDLLGLLPVVIFRPEDVELISGSSGNRRKYLDNILSQVDKQYENSLSTYDQALKRRNKILDAIRDGISSRHALTFWDALLIKHGNVVSEKRSELVDYINSLFSRSDLFKSLKVDYEMSSVSEARLNQYKDAELALGYTLVGPHKDDLSVRDSGRVLATFGSRGEQRMAVLAMKMAEIYFLENKGGKKALLLLDDIFSELDIVHKKEVLRVTEGRQVVVTTADENDVVMFEAAKRINL